MGDGIRIKPETAKDLKNADAAVKVVDQENAKIQPAYKKTSEGLESAIKDSNTSMIELYRPKLEKIVADMDNCMAAVESALAQIGFLQKDEDFMNEHFEVVEKLMKKVTATQKQLTDQLVQAKDLDKRASEALDKAEGGQEQAIRELAVLKDQVADLKKAVDYVDQEAPKLEGAAKTAFGKRDQKGLTDARLKLIDFQKYGTAMITARGKVNAFLKKYPDKGLTTEATYLLDDLTRMDSTIKDLNQTVKDLITLGQVKQIDVAKAVKVLGLSSKDQDKLGKILRGPQQAMAKALQTAFGKQLKMSGDEMVDELEKAGVLD